MSDEITKDIAIPIGESDAGNMILARIQGTEDRPVRATVGELRPLKEGEPIMGDVISLSPREGCRHLDVTTVIEDPLKAERAKAREAQSSGRMFSFPSAKYQANWDQVFGKKPARTDVN